MTQSDPNFLKFDCDMTTKLAETIKTFDSR